MAQVKLASQAMLTGASRLRSVSIGFIQYVAEARLKLETTLIQIYFAECILKSASNC